MQNLLLLLLLLIFAKFLVAKISLKKSKCEKLCTAPVLEGQLAGRPWQRGQFLAGR
jgi:hypothetical protein